MKKLIYFFTLLFSSMVIGQINYEPGYFISNDGIKTECLIRNTNWRNTPLEFKYILNENDDDPKTETINNVKEFAIINDVKFKRFALEIDRSSFTTRNLTFDKNIKLKNETLFLKIINEGDVNLYEYTDEDLIRFFVSSGNHEKVEQLIYKEYLAENDKIGKNTQFRQQLFLLLKSESLKSENFEKLKYRREDLTKLFNKYNKTKNPTFVEIIEKKGNGGLNLKVIVGLNSSSISFDNNSVTSTAFSEDFKKMTFKAGVELEYVMKFQKNKWALFIDPNFQSFSDKTNLNNQRTIHVDYKIIQIPIGVRHYFFINDNSKLFINAGYSLNISQNSSLKYKFGTLDYPIESKFKIPSTSNAFVGFGYSIKKYSLEFRYNFPTVLSDGVSKITLPQWESKYSSFGLNLGYRFY